MSKRLTRVLVCRKSSIRIPGRPNLTQRCKRYVTASTSTQVAVLPWCYVMELGTTNSLKTLKHGKSITRYMVKVSEFKFRWKFWIFSNWEDLHAGNQNEKIKHKILYFCGDSILYFSFLNSKLVNFIQDQVRVAKRLSFLKLVFAALANSPVNIL